MKRNIVIYIGMSILIISMCSFIASAAEPKLGSFVPASKSGYVYGYRFFNGFDFDEYKPSREGLEAILKAEVKKIKDNDKAGGIKYHVVIGHSQGGPRALGYATYVNKNDAAEYDRLQAVITMSGIDKGLKALDGGRGVVVSRIKKDVNVLYDGIHAALDINPLQAYVIDKAIRENAGSHANFKVIITNWLINDILPDEFSIWVKPLMDTSTDLDDIAEIRDMIPRSDYLNTYVSDSKKHTYKVKVGRERVWKWKFKWYCGIYYWYDWEDVYEIKTMYEDVPKFPDEIPVGYLVGMNSDTFSFMDKDTKDKIRSLCDTAEIAMNVAGGMYVGKCVSLWGLFDGSIGDSKDCFDAAHWFGDIDGELNELKGSKQNDGLVAKESQYIPKTFKDPNTGKTRNVHTNVVGSGKNGYTEFPKHNHDSIRNGDNEDVMKEVRMMIDQSTAKRKR